MTTIDGDDDSYDEIDKILEKIWRNADGKVHRDGDLPAVIVVYGYMYYYKNGVSYKIVDWGKIIRNVVISFILSIVLLSLVFLTHKYIPSTTAGSQNSTQH